jgi:hypothetical protein
MREVGAEGGEQLGEQGARVRAPGGGGAQRPQEPAHVRPPQDARQRARIAHRRERAVDPGHVVRGGRGVRAQRRA